MLAMFVVQMSAYGVCSRSDIVSSLSVFGLLTSEYEICQKK